MSWWPLLTKIDRLKLCLQCAPTRAATKDQFDAFVADNPDDAELELASTYYGYALFRLDGFR